MFLLTYVESVLTNTPFYTENNSQVDLERALDNDSVELQKFAPRIEDEKPEIPDDVIGPPFGAAPAYHVVGMTVPGIQPPCTGIRIDVEKTSM